MGVCKQCGAFMKFTDLLCPQCGTPVGVESPVVSEKEMLIRRLTKLRDLLGETAELKSMIKPQSDFPMSDNQIYKKRSMMKFFWPFLVGGIGGANLIYAISYVIAVANAESQMYSTSMSSTKALSNATEQVLGGWVVAIIVGLGIIILGIKISKSKQRAFNENAEYMNRMATEKYEKGLQNQKMINLYQEDIQELHQYENLVPEEFQTYGEVDKIINLIKEDQAQTIEEACAILRG